MRDLHTWTNTEIGILNANTTAQTEKTEMDNKIREFALREAERNAELVWNQAWKAGYNRARKEYADLRDGETIMEPPTKEQREEYGNELVGWCSRCSKPFNGSWAGLINFCPWCGRPVRWGGEEAAKK